MANDPRMGLGDRAKWTWARLGDISLAKDLALYFFGAKGLLALAVAGVTVAMGYADHFPLTGLFLLGLLAFTLTIWGWVGVARLWVGAAPTGRPRRLRKQSVSFADELPFDRPAVNVTPGRKPYLLLEEQKVTIDGGSGSHPMSSEYRIGLRSTSPIDLKNCRISTVWLQETYGGRIKFRRPIEGANGFTIHAGALKTFLLITRDLASIVECPPHYLRLDPGGKQPLPDNQTFLLQLVVESEYEFPTTATLMIRTGIEADLEVKIRDQFV